MVNLKENKLNYYNNFSFKTREDFIYFLLSAIENLNLNPEDVDLVLMGEINKGMKSWEMIHRYIRSFRFIEKNENLQYSYIFDELTHHNYYTLFSRIQCE